MDNNVTKKSFNFNYLSVILIYVCALIFLFSTFKIKDADSRIFPYVVSILAIVLATVFLIRTYFKLGKKKEELDFTGTKSALYMAGLLLLYIGAIVVLGFYLATPFYLYISMSVLGQKNKKLKLIISLLVPIGSYVFFDLFLNMQIPESSLLPLLM